jgi:glycosyltransferase involved in cell wall biosynthesis
MLFEVDRLVACRLANVVIAPSREMGDTFLDIYGCDGERVEVIEHGLDLTRFDPHQADGERVRTELGLTDKLVFGAISKHYWVKNLAALVRAFADAAAARPDAHLVILGVGDSSALTDLVRELRLSSRVSIVPRRHDIPDVLAAFDVFVHAALAESFGFAIIEAMAMAKPVATTRVGIARDVIEDGVSGFEIAQTDSGSLRDAMLRTIALRERWPALGAEARRRALWFTPERWVSRHEELYLRRLGFETSDDPVLGETPHVPAGEADDESSGGPPGGHA